MTSSQTKYGKETPPLTRNNNGKFKTPNRIFRPFTRFSEGFAINAFQNRSLRLKEELSHTSHTISPV